MIELVEFSTPFVLDGEIQYDEDDQPILESRQGVVLNWGTEPVESENGVGQITVVFVRESESGEVIKLYPEEIKYL